MEERRKKGRILGRGWGFKYFFGGPADDGVVHRNPAEPHDIPWNPAISGGNKTNTSDREEARLS